MTLRPTGLAALCCLAGLAWSSALAHTARGPLGPPADHVRLLVQQARSNYTMDMARCQRLTGEDRAVCIKEARAAQAEALAYARSGHALGEESRPDAAADTGEAQRRMALERCDALTDVARSSCITAVNALFGRY